MGRRGPPPQPTRIKLLKGNPGKRAINEREPQPRIEAPSCPRWLSADAKHAWRQVVSHLKNMRILARADRDALTAYCVTFAQWKDAVAFLEKHGMVYPLRDERGNVRCMQQMPQVAIARNLVQILQRYQQEFGMTPSARTRVHAIPILERDPRTERFFNRNRTVP